MIPLDDQAATVGNGAHIGFVANSEEAVDEFHKAARKAGAHDNGAPGPGPHYGDAYYGCFIIDLDGYKIEASYWDTSAG